MLVYVVYLVVLFVPQCLLHHRSRFVFPSFRVCEMLDNFLCKLRERTTYSRSLLI